MPNPDSDWIYGVAEGSGVIDPGVQDYINPGLPAIAGIPLVDGWQGVWELLWIVVYRVNGVASLTMRPQVQLNNDPFFPLYGAGIAISTALVYVAQPMAFVRIPAGGSAPLIYLGATGGNGDLFVGRTLWRRRQNG